MPIRTTIQRHRAQWILNALSYVKPESLASKGMISWIATKVDLFGITLPKGFTIH